MIDSTPLRAWTSGCGRGSACWWGFGCEPSHRFVLGRAHTTRYERSLRPCAARFAAAQNTQGHGTDHLARLLAHARGLADLAAQVIQLRPVHVADAHDLEPVDLGRVQRER